MTTIARSIAATGEAPLSAESWRVAALQALSEGGVAAVAIEPIAKRLGVTKGSGYWHFKSREALLRAALEEWEARTTEQIIARLLEVADPRERLIILFRQAFAGSLDASVYLALLVARNRPEVASALQRVAKRRVAFLEDCYGKLGYRPPAARPRAVAAYAAYLGIITLHAHAADIVPARERDAFSEHLIEALI